MFKLMYYYLTVSLEYLMVLMYSMLIVYCIVYIVFVRFGVVWFIVFCGDDILTLCRRY